MTEKNETLREVTIDFTAKGISITPEEFKAGFLSATSSFRKILEEDTQATTMRRNFRGIYVGPYATMDFVYSQEESKETARVTIYGRESGFMIAMGALERLCQKE